MSDAQAPKKCAGYVYYADQGIEFCEACGGCLCCDVEDVDHADARYRCSRLSDGSCWLAQSEHHRERGHDCERDNWAPKP
jgi:hypothetical protein